MRAAHKLLGVLIGAAGWGATPAAAALIDFESLAHAGEFVVIDSPPVYEEDGFRLTAQTGFASWGTASPHYAGSAALYNDYFDEFITLERSDAQPFFLTSIALAEAFDDGAAIAVEFIGTKSDTTTVSQTFVLDGFHDGTPASFQGFAFDAAFTDLVSVRWLQTPDFHQFDDIAATAIPEPGTAALLAAGLLALARRR